ncbi:sensor histidine kinase [Caulobacter mirabilis]|uniref:histidine kinase n=1 Tax=Caulobacter mirabilis TaxID=69666 RepID=A0A2D2B3Q6_9CAUL|nr:sensor histidine kinase [Caulobacter mirabilis]
MPGLSGRSLVGRLVLLAAGWSVVVLIVTGLALTAFFQQAALRRFDQGLIELTEVLNAGINIKNGEVVVPPVNDTRSGRAFAGRYWEIAEHGSSGKIRAIRKSHSLFDTELKVSDDVIAGIAAQPGTAIYFNTIGPLDQPLRASGMQVQLDDRAQPVIILVAEDRSPIDREAERFALMTGAALLALGAGILAAVFLQVRIGLQPLFSLRREVAEVRKGRAERIEGDYPTELEPLARELNALVAHNQDVVERQRTHVGNLAHALKTPLSVMLTEAQQQPSQLSEVVTRQAEAMRNHVEHHLRRARAAARSQSMGERTLVEPVIDELAVTLERIFQRKGVEIDWRCPDDLCFRGEKQDLMEVAGNVMENAGKWCKAKVRVTAEIAGPETLLLRVEDDGPGLPAERRGEVLKRGARLDESAPGSGLGLAIVDELARAYGGTVTLGDAAMGGLKVEIVLPRAEA